MPIIFLLMWSIAKMIVLSCAVHRITFVLYASNLLRRAPKDMPKDNILQTSVKLAYHIIINTDFYCINHFMKLFCRFSKFLANWNMDKYYTSFNTTRLHTVDGASSTRGAL